MIARLRAAIRNLVALLTLTSTTMVEFWSSLSFLAAGACLFSTWLNLEISIPFQRELLSKMPEQGWAALFFGLGAAQSLANLFRISFARMTCAFLSACVGSFMALVAAMVEPPSFFFPWMIAHAGVNLLSFYVMSRARGRMKRVSGERPAVA
jgi:hypothetical protein